MSEKISPTLQGIGYMVAAMACYAVMNIFIRSLAGEMHSLLMVFMRNLCAMVIMIPWVLHYGTQTLATTRLKSHLWRSGVGIISMELWFHSLSIMPVNQATALSFTTPLFVTLIAIVFLGEKAGIRRFAALAAGFAGVLVIIRPGITMGVEALFVLGASAMMAIAGILVKTLSQTEKPGVIVFYMSMFMTLFSLPASIPYWQPITLSQFGRLFMVALFSTIMHFLLVRAYKRADMVVLMPFDFCRLVFTALLAYVVFQEMIDGWTVLGGGIIVCSTVYITYRETYARKTSVLFDVPRVSD